MDNKIPFSLIFLAGGIGTRMKAAVPKQYLVLCKKHLALHSFEQFLSLNELEEIVVVCDPSYQALFSAYEKNVPIRFAQPGLRRQDSTFNGLQQLKNPSLVCIHDSVRPFITPSLIRSVIQEANEWGAAALGVRVKSTIKRCDGAQIVVDTPLREHLWEIQTPQVIRADLLKEGFQEADMKQITVTDDVSLVELLGQPVKIVEGSSTNIKVTTPEDLLLAERLMDAHVCL